MITQTKEIKVTDAKITAPVSSFLPHIKQAILIRKTEEKLLELFSQGKLNGTVHTCVGQEFSAVLVMHDLLQIGWNVNVKQACCGSG